MIRHNYGLGQEIGSDASPSGYGLVSGELWMAGYFNYTSTPRMINESPYLQCHWLNLDVGTTSDLNINVLELLPIWLACVLRGYRWESQQIICWSDNTQVVAAINKGISANQINMHLLRDIFCEGFVRIFTSWQDTSQEF